MSRSRVDTSWLLSESLTIGGIVLAGFLLAHLLGVVIGAVGLELLYGVEETLVAVVRYTTLLTALLYAISEGSGESSSPRVPGDD